MFLLAYKKQNDDFWRSFSWHQDQVFKRILWQISVVHIYWCIFFYYRRYLAPPTMPPLGPSICSLWISLPSPGCYWITHTKLWPMSSPGGNTKLRNISEYNKVIGKEGIAHKVECQKKGNIWLTGLDPPTPSKGNTWDSRETLILNLYQAWANFSTYP